MNQDAAQELEDLRAARDRDSICACSGWCRVAGECPSVTRARKKYAPLIAAALRRKWARKTAP